MDRTFCCETYVLLWSVRSGVELCSAVERTFCCGAYVLLWSVRSAVELMFCCASYVLPWSVVLLWSVRSAVEYMFCCGVYVPQYFATAHYSDPFFAFGARICLIPQTQRLKIRTLLLS